LRKGHRILDVPDEYFIRSEAQSIASLSLREVEKDDSLQPTPRSPLPLPLPTFNEHGQKVFDSKSLRITNQLDIELEVAAPLHAIPSLSVTRPQSTSSLSSSSLLPDSPATQKTLRKVPRPPQLIIPPPPSPSKLKPAHLSQQKSFSFLNNSPSESSSTVQDYPPTREDTTDTRRYTRSTVASSGSTLSRDSYERTSPNGLRLTPRASMPVYTLNLPPLPNSERNSWDIGRRRESLGSIPSVV
ncbi:2451_t:CDS:1, partial [Paraglomus occultum]